MKISQTDEFQRDFKRLSKKYKTMEDDFQIFLQVVLNEPKGNGTKHWNLITKDNETFVFKVRMSCRSVPKGSDFRVVYVYQEGELQLTFIELYFKGDKENEDKKRIEQYIKNSKL